MFKKPEDCEAFGGVSVFSDFQGMRYPVTTPQKSTPPKFNMEPENKSLEKESPFENHYFQVPC